MKTTQFESQLESAITEYETTMSRCRFDDGSDMGTMKHQELLTACFTAIQRASGKNSTYSKLAICRGDNEWIELASAVGVCKQLLSDIRKGYTQEWEELVHADVFSDYMEMAEHFLNLKYKDAAAVIAGSTLEAHLRKLCAKFSVPTIDGKGKPIKADKLNADLCPVAYNLLEQKSVTAWLDLRNKAAHGHYREYEQGHVSLMHQGILDFMGRHPA